MQTSQTALSTRWPRPQSASTAEWIASLPRAERDRVLSELVPTLQDKAALEFRWDFWARPKQLEPAGNWLVWLLLAGRGFGKTRTGAEWIRLRRKRGARRIALVARTAADTRDVMVEGESGILACSPPWDRPKYEPSKRRLTWKDGAQATLYSADEPDLLRGPQHDTAWADELAAWRYPDAWDQLMFGLRLGDSPRVVVTTTPRPTKIIRELVAAATTHITRGGTKENRGNLAPSFLERVVGKYAGTRLGRQELDGELLEDVAGALWRRAMIDDLRVREYPELKRVVIAIDPSVSDPELVKQNLVAETGIVAVGLGINDHAYVLDDLSGHLSPHDWATRAVNAYETQGADRVVAEVNNGGALVEVNIRTVSKTVAYRSVHASRGKRTRAEPVSALYEQKKVHHVGSLPELEDQMCTWDASAGERSPDRMDALVWGVTDLMLGPGGERRDYADTDYSWGG